MKTNCGKHQNERGAVLISAIAFAIVISFILAGIATLTMSHYQRATTEGDYANALNVAEAGIDYLINRLSSPLKYSCTNATTAAYQAGSPGTANFPSSGTAIGSFSVYITNEGDDGTGNMGAWAAPSPGVIWSTGTVNGVTANVSRNISIRAKAKGIFDEFALFGVNTSGFSGNYIIDGQYGANGDISSSGNSSVVYGNIKYNGDPGGTYTGNIGYIDGGAATPVGPYGKVIHQPNKVVWPTVSDVADKAATVKAGVLGVAAPVTGGGLSWFKTFNDNSQIQVFSAADAALTDPSSIAGRQPAALLQEVHGGSLYWVLNNKGGWSQATTDLNTMDKWAAAPATQRYVFPDTTWTYQFPSNSVTVAHVGMYNSSVIILPGSGNQNVYRDYYFENITQTGSQIVLVDTARGPIRVWLNASDNYYSASDDVLGTWIFTTNTTPPIVTATSNPSQFRMYSAKGTNSGGGVKGVLSLPGGIFFPGGMYVYNGPSTPSQVQFSGSSVVYGSVIAGSFGGNGNPLIKFPNNSANATPSDWSLWWGFRNQWIEHNGANNQ